MALHGTDTETDTGMGMAMVVSWMWRGQKQTDITKWMGFGGEKVFYYFSNLSFDSIFSYQAMPRDEMLCYTMLQSQSQPGANNSFFFYVFMFINIYEVYFCCCFFIIIYYSYVCE